MKDKPGAALSNHYCHPPPANPYITQEKVKTSLLMPTLAIGCLEIAVKISSKKVSFNKINNIDISQNAFVNTGVIEKFWSLFLWKEG